MPLTYPSFNICIIRPPGYIWSSVFQELADLIFYSLEDLGCTVKIHENKIQTSAVNVVIGAHLLDHKMILALPKDTVVFNTEQMGAGSRRWNEKIKLLVSRYTSWDYSLQNILEFGHAGLTHSITHKSLPSPPLHDAHLSKTMKNSAQRRKTSKFA